MDKLDYSDLDAEIIDITPQQKRREQKRQGGRIKWFVLAALLLLVVAGLGLSVYTEALWFGSLGFASRFWYVFNLGWILFAVFGFLTFAIVRGGFYLLERLFSSEIDKPRRIVLNKQPVDLNFARFLRPVSWIVAIVFGIGFGLGLSRDWQTWMLYLHQPVTTTTDPIFGNSLGFYLFTLPIYNELSSWLTTLALLLLAGASCLRRFIRRAGPVDKQ